MIIQRRLRGKQMQQEMECAKWSTLIELEECGCGTVVLKLAEH